METKIWLKTTLTDDGEGGMGPDFYGIQVNGWSQIAATLTDWIGLVCAEDDSVSAFEAEPRVSVYLIDGDENFMANVLEVALALGGSEDAVRVADVSCD